MRGQSVAEEQPERSRYMNDTWDLPWGLEYINRTTYEKYLDLLWGQKYKETRHALGQLEPQGDRELTADPPKLRV